MTAVDHGTPSSCVVVRAQETRFVVRLGATALVALRSEIQNHDANLSAIAPRNSGVCLVRITRGMVDGAQLLPISRCCSRAAKPWLLGAQIFRQGLAP